MNTERAIEVLNGEIKKQKKRLVPQRDLIEAMERSVQALKFSHEFEIMEPAKFEIPDLRRIC